MTVNWSTGTGLGFMIGVAVFLAVIIWAQSSVRKEHPTAVETQAGQVER